MRCLAPATLGDRADHCQRLAPAAETRFDPLRRLRVSMALSRIGWSAFAAPICPDVFLKVTSSYFRVKLPSIRCFPAQGLSYTNDLTPQNIAKDYPHARLVDATGM